MDRKPPPSPLVAVVHSHDLGERNYSNIRPGNRSSVHFLDYVPRNGNPYTTLVGQLVVRIPGSGRICGEREVVFEVTDMRSIPGYRQSHG